MEKESENQSTSEQEFTVKIVKGWRQRQYYELEGDESIQQNAQPRNHKQNKIPINQYLVVREESGRETWEDERILATSKEAMELVEEYKAEKAREDLAE